MIVLFLGILAISILNCIAFMDKVKL
jgi:hypothetical protein